MTGQLVCVSDDDHRAHALGFQEGRRGVVADQRCVLAGVEGGLLHHGEVHPGPECARRQDVRLDAVRLALERQRAREPQEPGFRRRVVGLRVRSEHAGAGRHRHDPAPTAGLHDLERGVEHAHHPTEVHVDDGVEVVDGHLVERLVAEDRRVRDHRVQAAPLVHRLLGEAGRSLGCRHRLGVGDRLATGGPDLLDDGLGQPRIAPTPEGVAAEVVHDDPRAAAGELQRVTATHAAAGAGHHDHVPFEAQRAHPSPRLVPSRPFASFEGARLARTVPVAWH